MEFIPILNSLANSQHNLKKSEKALVATEKHRAIATIATQVAHDIRSPLAALNMMMKDVLTLPEDKRIIMRSAVTRIQDIANDLLSKNRQIQMFDDGDATTFLSQGTQFAPEDDELQTVLLHGVLESIVSEKRIQYRGNPGISIDLQLDSDSYGIFASIQVREFKRVMSNLVNNAVEAEAKMETLSPSIGEHTRQHLVTITSRRDRDDKEVRKGLILEITDNGRGIHPEVLAQISGEDQGGQWRRRSFGKLSGNGIGLFHAKKTIENWGGQLTINSGGVGLGTTVQIRLPEQEAPVYFLPELVLEASMEVVAVDDDYSIHQIWHGRLESLRARDKNIRFRSFTDLKQFMIWHAEQTPRPSSHHYLYLVDYEFLGEEANGIDIIECLRLQPAGGQTILVTSRHEEEAVIARCEQLKIKLLPKGLAGFVPMQIHSSAHRSDNNLHILVDDDQLIRIVWQAKAKEKGIHLLVFASGEELLSRPQFAATFCQKTTIFYLDANLGDSGMRGEDLAQELFHRGFEQLYLATGYDCNQFSHFNLSFIRGVIGKIAPW